MKNNIEALSKKIPKAIDEARKVKEDFSISINQADLQNHLRALLNHHITVNFPGLELGFFPDAKKKG
jgi:hypothetical protein